MRRLGNIQIRPETSKQLKTALRVLMDTHLDLRLKSRSFLDSLERFAPDPAAPAVPRRRMPAPESAEDSPSEASPSGGEEAVDPEDA